MSLACRESLSVASTAAVVAAVLLSMTSMCQTSEYSYFL